MRTFSLLVASLGLATGALAFYTSSQQHNSWNYLSCGSGNEPIQISSFAVSPDPPQPGQNLTMTVKYEVAQEIEGYVHVSVKLGSINFFQKRVDVCKKARGANASAGCTEIQPGSDYTVERITALPKEIPLAKYIVDARGYTNDGGAMLCLQLMVDFKKRPF